jgi:antitoxin YefM
VYCAFIVKSKEAADPIGRSDSGPELPPRPESSQFLGLAVAGIRAYACDMQTLPISKVKDRLNDLVDAASITHEQVTITKNGTPAAVLIGMDEWESLQETLFWLSQPGIRESIGAAMSDVGAGLVQTQEQIRAEFNVPSRDK